MEKFWSKIDKSGTHWIWKGKMDNRGRPFYNLNRTGRSAYKLSLLYSGIPVTSRLVNKCGNPLCVKPRHITEMKGRPRVFRNGRKNASLKKINAFLSEESRAEIRALYVPGVYSQEKLAKQFGVKRSLIRLVLKSGPIE